MGETGISEDSLSEYRKECGVRFFGYMAFTNTSVMSNSYHMASHVLEVIYACIKNAKPLKPDFFDYLLL